jgi:large subunit ribosomal protein L35
VRLRNPKSGIMPKQKTHKGMKKRYKLTASGKVKHRKRGRGHLLSSKASKRKRHLRQDAVIGGVWAKNIAHGLRPGS